MAFSEVRFNYARARQQHATANNQLRMALLELAQTPEKTTKLLLTLLAHATGVHKHDFSIF